MTQSKKNNVAMKAILLAVLIGVMALSIWLAPYFATGAPAEGMIKLRKGSTVEQATESIAANIDTQFAQRVGKLLSMTGADLTARQGAFKVSKGDSPFRVMRLLRSGAESGIKFTFNNVRTREEFADRWGGKFMMGRDEMLRVLNDPIALTGIGRTPDNVTAMLLPDSYEFYWDITPTEFLVKMKGYYDKFWNEERIAKARKLGLTPDQVAVVASIVEEETAKADERPKVARLYLNRLKQNMPLQADPTVKYAIGDFSIKRITNAMTRTQSPYNTYVNPGLPPGPIRIPEKGTLDAVLNAPDHNYIYMCAAEDFSGYHNFAVDYGTHMANARRYQAALNARGIK
ncbi:MAG: endolytic transglycosylase MltG [Muribaculaceae bacterium]|nr:endolytic transglycosylase MltG [Muribaculaceae bacterium]MBR1725613.1 endolytic transglycosylase MltG [Muribaculaceae bacterium]